MITWMNDLNWSKIVEWCSILGIGFMVMFRLGRFAKTQEHNKEEIKRHEKLLVPDDPGNDIIRQHDLNRLEKLLLVHEERLKLFIQVEIGKVTRS